MRDRGLTVAYTTTYNKTWNQEREGRRSLGVVHGQPQPVMQQRHNVGRAEAVLEQVLLGHAHVPLLQRRPVRGAEGLARGRDLGQRARGGELEELQRDGSGRWSCFVIWGIRPTCCISMIKLGGDMWTLIDALNCQGRSMVQVQTANATRRT